MRERLVLVTCTTSRRITSLCVVICALQNENQCCQHHVNNQRGIFQGRLTKGKMHLLKRLDMSIFMFTHLFAGKDPQFEKLSFCMIISLSKHNYLNEIFSNVNRKRFLSNKFNLQWKVNREKWNMKGYIHI